MKQVVILSVMWLSAIAGLLLSASPAIAESTNFNQKILPLDCVFTVIDAGTGELQYVTPKECGVLLNPYTSGPSQTANNPAGSALVPSPYSSIGNSGSGSQNYNLSQLAWRPLVGLSQSNRAVSAVSTHSTLVAGAVAGTGLLAVVVLLVLF